MQQLTLADASAIASIVGAVAGVLTLVATVVIAAYAHRLTRKLDQAASRRELLTHLREQRKDIREALSAFDEAFSTWMGESAHRASAYEPVHRRGQELAATIEAATGETALLTPTLNVMRGHASWISDPRSTTRWLTESDPIDDDADWAAGVVNAALDVTKDGVLAFTATVDDASLLADDFWEEPSTAGIPGPAPEDAAALAPHAPETVHLAAQDRWMPQGAAPDAAHRFRALIRYKVHLEHALEFTARADLGAAVHGAAREERFLIAARMVMARLRDDVAQHAGQAVGAVNARVDDLLAPQA